ncbi:MAG TPA: fused MFS/spermidine synthase [Caulobacteraceae bacterium]|nr:fused MFS/spermidine synthase [Caulobacteraceae bacterium]
MTQTAAMQPGAASAMVRWSPLLFGVTVFTSAGLVFMVEPMIAKLILPTLGGSPAVWNTSMAFFQIALLVGYGYAHLLQRIRSLKAQAVIHALVILAAALALPLRVSDLFGAPQGRFPIPWLLGVLTVSIGAPFAALSATAPLAQAWYARVRAGHADAANPYVLYAASNLGSLLALLAYPAIVEPQLRLKVQTLGWSAGYVVFLALMIGLALISVFGSSSASAAPIAASRGRIGVRQRLIWITLSAIPSSLMLGVTAHMTEDIASAPFLWVAPLALYLLTFILAFSGWGSGWLKTQAQPQQIQGDRSPMPLSLTGALIQAIRREGLPALQAAALVGLAFSFGVAVKMILLMILVQLVGFFLTALICHQQLAFRRPEPAHLTEFYLWISVGGVIGGGFNAFVAPLVFPGIWEFPIVVVAACLARPWNWRWRLEWWEIALSVIGVLCAAVAVTINQMWAYGVIHTPKDLFLQTLLAKGPRLLFTVTPVCAFLLRERAFLFAAMVLAVLLGGQNLQASAPVLAQERSFFGVLRVTRTSLPGYAENVRLLAHGTTLHGAQAMDASNPCVPMTYYAPETPIGQVVLRTGQEKRNMVVGAIGMGTGSIAAYARPDDEYRFYEIDPTVVAISATGTFFTFIKGCAHSPHLDVRLGDARLQLQKAPPGAFDVLLVDAFSSDAIPAHLLTVEAMKMYLSKMRPDGVVIMHLSNRNLDLIRPVAATAKAAGGYALLQHYLTPNRAIDLVASDEDVIIVGRSKEALEPYRQDWRWEVPDEGRVRPWTDDYTNLFGAMIRRIGDKRAQAAEMVVKARKESRP